MAFSYPTFHSQPRSLLNARYRYEAARSFDLDDDLEFCPALLSDEELQSVHSGSSDGSSLSSGSPNGSPLQHQIQPSSASSSYSYSSHSSYGAPINSYPTQAKIQQTTSQRTRNAIPIVNPNTGMRVASPPHMIPHPTQRSHHHSGASRRPW
ncbi:hypothetical protein ABW19_dt0206176 [Dactylella cylindrospora]|nr:hypothetical protein ABW19_dt0206176 [Dactylella cylindrospora]